jgi:hypothetical protein
MSGLSTLVHAPLGYKRGDLQRYKGTQTQLRLSILKLPQQSNTQWSRVLCPGGPNHSKSSRVHVLDVRLAGQAKRLSPFLILGFRAGALHHPVGEFPLLIHSFSLNCKLFELFLRYTKSVGLSLPII